MKIIKGLLYFVGIVIAIFLLAGLFLPKNLEITVAEAVNVPQQKAFDYMKVLANQKDYSEWVKADPNNQTTVDGTDGTVGAVYSWKGNDEVGEGKMAITNVTDTDIVMNLTFIKPMPGVAQVTTKVLGVDSTTATVSQTYKSDGSWPMNTFSYLIGKPMIESTTAKNLKNVKGILEAK